MANRRDTGAGKRPRHGRRAVAGCAVGSVPLDQPTGAADGAGLRCVRGALRAVAGLPRATLAVGGRTAYGRRRRALRTRDGGPMIHFDNVSVAYPDATLPVLRDVQLTIPEGELCLVVGRTGSG